MHARLPLIPDHLLEQMRSGINGNLACILKKQSPELGHVERNKWAGHDLIIGAPRSHGYGLVEIKLVYECTEPKYYNDIARDYLEKLATARQKHSDARLFLVVFFVECPS